MINKYSAFLLSFIMLSVILFLYCGSQEDFYYSPLTSNIDGTIDTTINTSTETIVTQTTETIVTETTITTNDTVQSTTTDTTTPTTSSDTAQTTTAVSTSTDTTGSQTATSTPNNPPTVILSEPTDWICYVTDNDIHIAGTVTDTTGGIERIELYVHDTVTATLTATSVISYDYVDVSDGHYWFYAVAYDTYGLAGTSDVINVLVDLVDPAVHIISPTNGETVSPTIQLIGTSFDETWIDNVYVSIDGGTASIASGIDPWTYDPPTALTDGTHTITVASESACGQVSPYHTIQIIVDENLPSCRITYPPSFDCLSTSNFTMNGTAFDLSGIDFIHIYIDSTFSGTATGTTSWSYPINGLSGTHHTLSAIAFDINGSESTPHHIPMTIDLIDPTGSYITSFPVQHCSSSITISGTASDDHGIASILVNGQSAIITPDDWSVTLTGLFSGTNNINTVLYDHCGNTSSLPQQIVVVDSDIPSGGPTFSVAGSCLYNWTNITISGSVTDSTSIDYVEYTVYDSSAVIITSGTTVPTGTTPPYSWSYTFNIPYSDTFEISHTAYDSCGNSAHLYSETFTVHDILTDIFPDSMYYEDSNIGYSIPLAGTYNMASCYIDGTISYTINGDATKYGVDNMSGGVWSSADITTGLVPDSTNSIEVTIEAGSMTATKVIIVVLSDAAGDIIVNNLDDTLISNYLSSGFIRGTASDPDGLDYVEFSFDGGPYHLTHGTDVWDIMIPSGTQALTAGFNTWQNFTHHSVVLRVVDVNGGETLSPVYNFIKAPNHDINGDGYSDVVVGAPNYTVSINNEGSILVYYGSAAGINTTYDHVFPAGLAAGDKFGYSVAFAGDVDGNGFADVVVGTPFMDYPPYNNSGAIYIYPGSQSGLMLMNTKINCPIPENSGKFGISVAGAGDVNGDGYDDVVVGANGMECSGNPNSGTAYVYYGENTGSLPSFDKIINPDCLSGNQFGTSVSTAGDMNNDSYADIVVGSPFADGGASSSGKIWVFDGQTGGIDLAGNPLQMPSPTSNVQFGMFVSCAGDVDNDGYTDVLTGAAQADNHQGISYLFHGTVSIIVERFNPAAVAYDYFGETGSIAGDVDADGHTDVLFGAYGAPNGSFYGAAYLYMGEAVNGLSSIDFQIDNPGGNTADMFGKAIASAGDVNGDGFGDVIIGAPDYNTDQGAAYLFYGETAGLPYTPNETLADSSLGTAQIGFSLAN